MVFIADDEDPFAGSICRINYPMDICDKRTGRINYIRSPSTEDIIHPFAHAVGTYHHAVTLFDAFKAVYRDNALFSQFFDNGTVMYELPVGIDNGARVLAAFFLHGGLRRFNGSPYAETEACIFRKQYLHHFFLISSPSSSSEERIASVTASTGFISGRTADALSTVMTSPTITSTRESLCFASFR